MRNFVKYALILGFLSVLVPQLSLAVFPPTTTKGQSDTSKTTTFNFQAPNYQMSKVDSTTALIETGNKNRLKDPGCESSTCVTSNWASPSVAPTRTTTAGQFYDGNAAISWDSNAAGQFLTSSTSAVKGGGGRNWAVSCLFKCASGTCTHTITGNDGTNDLATAQTITSDTSYFQRTTVNFPEPTSGSVKIKIASVASNEPAVYVDDCYNGPAEGFNLSQVSQATLYGTVSSAGAVSCAWSTVGSTSYTNLSADTDCASATATGGLTAPGTKIPGFVMNNAPPGEYVVLVSGGIFQKSGAGDAAAWWRLSDGTNSSGTIGRYYSTSATDSSGWPMQGHFTYTTAQSSVTIQIQGNAGHASNTATLYNNDAANEQLKFTVLRFPLSSETAYSANQVKQPTQTRLTSGTNATYTPPVGATMLHFRMVGGGGGGGGGGHPGTMGSGGGGGNTCFGTNATACTSPIFQANGGAGGSTSGSSSTATINSPGFGTANVGGAGQGFMASSASGQFGSGGHGGLSCFGGSGYGTANAAGAAASANSGSGGGGGGHGDEAATNYTGAGGGSGGCIDAWIPAPLSGVYYYTIGAAGTAGTAGTNGYAGAVGGAGYIEITEYYGNMMPILVGGVTAPDYAGATRINTVVSKSGNYTATDAEETIIFTADATLTLPAAANFKGKKYHVQANGAGVDVTIDPNSTELVCGASTILVSGDKDGVDIQSNGTNWEGLGGSCFKTTAAKINCDASAGSSLPYPNNWISSVGNRVAQGCAVGIVSGTFSATPVCTWSRDGNVEDGYPLIVVSSATSVVVYARKYDNTVYLDHDGYLSCTGPR